jgi:hypothetical protein
MTTSRLFVRAGFVGALGLFSLGLGACGKLGGLDRPSRPLFGQPRSEHRAMRDAAARANGEQDQSQTSATSTTNGDYSNGARDPALIPPRTAPAPGAINNGLSGGGSNGVLPDPYADPNRAPR